MWAIICRICAVDCTGHGDADNDDDDDDDECGDADGNRVLIESDLNVT